MLVKMFTENIAYREIAKILGKSISSISDEKRRNSIKKEYNPYEAERLAQERMVKKGKRTKLEISDGLRRYVEEKLMEDWSPDEIAGVLKEEAQGKTVISHETIYKYIYSSDGKKKGLWKHLRHRKKPERVHHGTRKQRPTIPHRVSIHQRPSVINERARYGDFEGDLMIFSETKKVLAVFVDRKTRRVVAVVNEDKTAKEMEFALHELITSVGISYVKSITFDNGLENVCHGKVRNDYCNSFNTYFCDSYCSWQKGTVENILTC